MAEIVPTGYTKCILFIVVSIHRVRTSSAIAMADEILRQKILDASPIFAIITAKVEEASGLVSLRIPNVPANTILSNGSVTVTEG